LPLQGSRAYRPRPADSAGKAPDLAGLIRPGPPDQRQGHSYGPGTCGQAGTANLVSIRLSYSSPFSLKYFSAPLCKGADRPFLTMSSFFRFANAGCKRLKSSKLSNTALTTL